MESHIKVYSEDDEEKAQDWKQDLNVKSSSMPIQQFLQDDEKEPINIWCTLRPH